MARVLFCETCNAVTGVILIDRLTICVTCRSEVVWREMGPKPLTFTRDDLVFLKELKIGSA